MPNRPLCFAVLSVICAGFAFPVLAAPSGDCLWAVTPEPNQKAMIDSYRISGVDGPSSLEVTDEMTAAYVTRCGVGPGQDAVDTGVILGLLVIEKGAETMLQEQGQIPVGTLPAVWERLPATEKDALRVYATGALGGKANDDDAEALAPIIQREVLALRLGSPALAQHVLAYLFGRAGRDAKEAGE